VDHSQEILLQTITIAVFAAILLQIIAARLRAPAIALLLIGGIVLGPQVFNLVQPDSLSSGLRVVIALAIAIILFEGGLTLTFSGLRQAPSVIRRMLTVGVAVTWFGSAAAIALLLKVNLGLALLVASLIIVTGPTVIGPILRRTRVTDRLHSILHWEGVIIDPIGVFVALACFEALTHDSWSALPLLQFVLRLGFGAGLGFAAGFALAEVLKREWISEEYDQLFVLTSALFVFGIADQVLHESGIMAVTIAGLVLGQREVKSLKRIKRFKLEITELSIGILFILLAARLDVTRFADLGVAGWMAVGAVLLVVRPLNVMASTAGSDLPWRERVFLFWLAPRGIVAASMASLFSLILADHPDYGAQAWILETFTYAVIGSTVMLQGFTAGPWASLLGVKKPPRGTWLIMGAHQLGQTIGLMLKRGGARVMLVDTNPDNVRQAEKRGLEVWQRNVLDPELQGDPAFLDVGSLLCTTGNAALDELACSKWGGLIGKHMTFHLAQGVGIAPEITAAEGTKYGVPIWSQAGPVQHLEGELEVGLATIRLTSRPPEHRPGVLRALPLFTIRGGVAKIHPEPDSAVLAGNARYIILERSVSGLSGYLRDFVELEAAHPQAKDVYRALVNVAVAYEPVINLEAVLGDLMEREASMPSYVGSGVSIPHAYVDGLVEPVCIGARLKKGLNTGNQSSDRVRLVFLLLSPRGAGEAHLKALGDLARIASDQNKLEALLEAPTPADGLQLLRDYDEALSGGHPAAA